MRYDIGDRPEVINGLMDTPDINAVSEMTKLEGRKVLIIDVLPWRELPYKILEDGGRYWWSDDMFKPPTLKEQYFQTGYVVERRNEEKFIVLRNGDEVALSCFDTCGVAFGWWSYTDYDDDLFYIDNYREYDIVKVYDRVFTWGAKLEDLIWQREEVEKITIKEAERIINRGITPRSKVKIVG